MTRAPVPLSVTSAPGIGGRSPDRSASFASDLNHRGSAVFVRRDSDSHVDEVDEGVGRFCLHARVQDGAHLRGLQVRIYGGHAVVGRDDEQRVVVQALRLQHVEDAADTNVRLIERRALAFGVGAVVVADAVGQREFVEHELRRRVRLVRVKDDRLRDAAVVDDGLAVRTLLVIGEPLRARVAGVAGP